MKLERYSCTKNIMLSLERYSHVRTYIPKKLTDLNVISCIEYFKIHPS